MCSNIYIEPFRAEIKRLKIALTILTFLKVVYFFVSVFGPHDVWIKIYFKYHANWIIAFLHLLVLGLFLWYNWKKLPITKKEKTNNTWMLVFLDIIGMWLWVPNKKEIDNLIN